MTSKAQLCVWDFTLSCAEKEKAELDAWLKENCKKWCYQKELAESGFEHYQGRVSLKMKTRNMKKVLEPAHWSLTSEENRDNFYYVEKEDTRLDGPWKDTDEVIYIPRQVREIESLKEWQQQIVDSASVWDTRTINYVYCPEGNIGKTTLVGWVRAHKIGRALPPVNDYKDLMRMVCDMPTSKMYLFDMPRSMNKERLVGFYSAIESIKDGYAWDDRYTFKEKIFDCPVIWIFSNTLPTTSSLSADRWKTYMVVNNKLIRRPSDCNTNY